MSVAAEQQEVCRLEGMILNILIFMYLGETETKDQGPCICVAVNIDAGSRSLYLYAKSLVHHMNRNKDHSALC